MRLIFLDSETTGLDPQKHRLLEIAYKIFDPTAHRFLLTYNAIVQQPEAVFAAASPQSLEINGFTQELVLQGKSEKAIAAEILDDFQELKIAKGNAVFICQNPSFDRAFFNQLISVEMQSSLNWPYHWLDLASMYWALNCERTEITDLSKNSIAKAYALPPEKRPHRALNGVDHLIACYQSLFEKAHIDAS